MNSQQDSPSCLLFKFSEARSLIADLQRPRQVVYWVDFLCSVIVGHITLHLIFWVHRLYGFEPWAIGVMSLSYVVTVLLYMRAVMFIHELVHLPGKDFKFFRIAWNGLCGIFFFVPSFLYYPHVDHHRRKHYGTDHDGEYLPLAKRGPWMLFGFIAQALIIPLLAVLRFLVISPICWIIPSLRPIVHRHLSTMVVDPFYERRDGSPKVMRIVILQEVLCFAWLVWFFVRGYVMRDQLIDPFWFIAYSVGVGILVLNEVRTLGAHRWTNDGQEMSFAEQLVDSVNYPDRPWITELWGPIGTRYHALHHLFPRLPYHNLGEAHRRLTEGLPADSIYHQTNEVSLTAAIGKLWKQSQAAATTPIGGASEPSQAATSN